MEQRETLVRRHIQLFEKQNKSEDDNKGSLKDLSAVEKKDKKDVSAKTEVKTDNKQYWRSK